MKNYVTVEEKAKEWGVTPRHVQNLCRKGRIDGVTKRVGAWFIPDDADTPTKNTKSNADAVHYVGTKRKIFVNAVELFLLNGFESISVKDIATRAGIRQSTVYNHFKSKQAILDAVYEYFCSHYQDSRPTTEELDQLIANGNLSDLFINLNYQSDEGIGGELNDILLIILQRLNKDEKARQIAKSLTIDSSVDYVEGSLNKAVMSGKTAPCDTRALSTIINSLRIYAFYSRLSDPSPEGALAQSKDITKSYRYLASLLAEKRIPIIN